MKTNKRSRLVSAIANLKEELTLQIVNEKLSLDIDPVNLLAEFQEGLRIVGERYEKQQYYLSGLVMGGEIFRETMELIKPYIKNRKFNDAKTKVLIGTVAGDIHDLGKNLVKMILEYNNFSVFDLGVDVKPAEFLNQVKEIEPDIIGLSGLIVIAYDSMRETIKLLRDENCKQPIIIGGSPLNEAVSKYTGADYWVTDAITGVDICKKIVKSKE
ncbi:MAG: cobalamin-dependent protein [Spirochaetes bacterium]|nr:cobalamin-dependent protein [Spirochaetota bacterium]